MSWTQLAREQAHTYVIWQCTAVSCRLRFPAPAEASQAQTCPICGQPTAVVTHPTNAHGSHVSIYPPPTNLPPIELLLDNIRSVYNVGSILRTADGAGVRRVHLCGITATPEHPKLAKTALGADETVPWTASRNAVDTAVSLREKGYRLWALEDTPTAVPLFAADVGTKNDPPLVLIVGNEVTGVDPDLLALCDQILFLPMQGRKRSLNVTIALGTAVYYLLYQAT